MDYNNPTSNVFKKCFKMFFLSLCTVCLGHLIQFKSQEIAKMNDRVQKETLTFFAQATRMKPPQSLTN